jgi:hypothetical protein
LIDPQKFCGPSHRDTRYEKQTQRLVYGPKALALLEIVCFWGPGLLAAKAAILRDFFIVASSNVERITTTGP